MFSFQHNFPDQDSTFPFLGSTPPSLSDTVAHACTCTGTPDPRPFLNTSLRARFWRSWPQNERPPLASLNSSRVHNSSEATRSRVRREGRCQPPSEYRQIRRCKMPGVPPSSHSKTGSDAESQNVHDASSEIVTATICGETSQRSQGRLLLCRSALGGKGTAAQKKQGWDYEKRLPSAPAQHCPSSTCWNDQLLLLSHALFPQSSPSLKNFPTPTLLFAQSGFLNWTEQAAQLQHLRPLRVFSCCTRIRVKSPLTMREMLQMVVMVLHLD